LLFGGLLVTATAASLTSCSETKNKEYQFDTPQQVKNYLNDHRVQVSKEYTAGDATKADYDFVKEKLNGQLIRNAFLQNALNTFNFAETYLFEFIEIDNGFMAITHGENHGETYKMFLENNMLYSDHSVPYNFNTEFKSKSDETSSHYASLVKDGENRIITLVDKEVDVGQATIDLTISKYD
jgi:hypothetical protein